MSRPATLTEAIDRIDRLELALNRIAAWPEGVVTGSFDEPNAARIAREALNLPTFGTVTHEPTGELL